MLLRFLYKFTFELFITNLKYFTMRKFFITLGAFVITFVTYAGNPLKSEVKVENEKKRTNSELIIFDNGREKLLPAEALSQKSVRKTTEIRQIKSRVATVNSSVANDKSSSGIGNDIKQ